MIGGLTRRLCITKLEVNLNNTGIAIAVRRRAEVRDQNDRATAVRNMRKTGKGFGEVRLWGGTAGQPVY